MSVICVYNKYGHRHTLRERQRRDDADGDAEMKRVREHRNASVNEFRRYSMHCIMCIIFVILPTQFNERND